MYKVVLLHTNKYNSVFLCSGKKIICWGGVAELAGRSPAFVRVLDDRAVQLKANLIFFYPTNGVQ